jgi:hypothetical protein
MSLVGPPLEGTIQEAEYRRVFELMTQERAQAFFVNDQSEHYTYSLLIIGLAEQSRLPTMFPNRYYAEQGGLISYGTDLIDGYRRAAGYITCILQGTKPSELPIDYATKIELLINLKTAKRSASQCQASLMARLDRLGPAKEVAQIGAAIGREFSHALLAAVVSNPEAELASALDRLNAAGLLFRQGVPPYATYLFKHALVQDADYGTLVRERRRALHARIAETPHTRRSALRSPEPDAASMQSLRAVIMSRTADMMSSGLTLAARRYFLISSHSASAFSCNQIICSSMMDLGDNSEVGSSAFSSSASRCFCDLGFAAIESLPWSDD